MNLRFRAIALAVLAACDGATPAPAQTAARLPRAASSDIEPQRRTAITSAVAAVAPAVVTVQTEVIERVAADPFESLFGGRSGRRITPGLGSGFVIRADGVILTNAHVVSGAQSVSVALRDGTPHPAAVIGVDEINDLAVLKIDATALPVAPLGNSDALLIGEWAIAIGNPYGFLLGNTEPSVTAGVVSGTGRNLVGGGEGTAAYLDMIQTDASINPGNSGGPLVNAAGAVIGVNSSIYSPTGSSIGLGFAIPINRARRVAEDLLRYGAVRRPWVGIQLELGGSGNPRSALLSGAVVRSVAPGSPAAAAGIRPGDVILGSRGQPLRNSFDWQTEVLDLRVGERVPIVIRRGDREIETTLTVADLPEVTAPKVEVLRELQLVTVTPAIRAERSIRSARGALVFAVSERISNELGIREGDVIVQINRMAITSADDVRQALDYFGGRGPIRMYFEHEGRIYQQDFIIR
ncbi:MAG: trypsin-like peptidase domain-containing protein [Gemmatimonadaceae bacterium]